MPTHPASAQPPLAPADKLLNAAAWLGLLATCGIAAASYAYLPANIPIHYGAAGLPDRYDDKSTIFILPVLALVIFGVLGQLSGRPHLLNYPVPITEGNTRPQFANASRMLRYVRFAVMAIFASIVWGTVQTALGRADGLGSWSLPLTLAGLFGPLACFVGRAVRLGGGR